MDLDGKGDRSCVLFGLYDELLSHLFVSLVVRLFCMVPSLC